MCLVYSFIDGVVSCSVVWGVVCLFFACFWRSVRGLICLWVGCWVRAFSVYLCVCACFCFCFVLFVRIIRWFRSFGWLVLLCFVSLCVRLVVRMFVSVVHCSLLRFLCSCAGFVRLLVGPLVC